MLVESRLKALPANAAGVNEFVTEFIALALKFHRSALHLNTWPSHSLPRCKTLAMLNLRYCPGSIPAKAKCVHSSRRVAPSSHRSALVPRSTLRRGYWAMHRAVAQVGIVECRTPGQSTTIPVPASPGSRAG